MCLASSLSSATEGKGFVAGAVVGHHASDRHAEAVVIGDGGLEEGDRALRLSSGMIMVKAMREAGARIEDKIEGGHLRRAAHRDHHVEGIADPGFDIDQCAGLELGITTGQTSSEVHEAIARFR